MSSPTILCWRGAKSFIPASQKLFGVKACRLQRLALGEGHAPSFEGASHFSQVVRQADCCISCTRGRSSARAPHLPSGPCNKMLVKFRASRCQALVLAPQAELQAQPRQCARCTFDWQCLEHCPQPTEAAALKKLKTCSQARLLGMRRPASNTAHAKSVTDLSK